MAGDDAALPPSIYVKAGLLPLTLAQLNELLDTHVAPDQLHFTAALAARASAGHSVPMEIVARLVITDDGLNRRFLSLLPDDAAAMAMAGLAHPIAPK